MPRPDGGAVVVGPGRARQPAAMLEGDRLQPRGACTPLNSRGMAAACSEIEPARMPAPMRSWSLSADHVEHAGLADELA